MDVGNDPFPREEVTGLAAFENLEPVNSLDLEPEPSYESETPAPRTLPPPLPSAAQRTAAEPEGAVPYGAADHPFSQSAPPHVSLSEERGDLTIPLDLSHEAISGTGDELFARDMGGWEEPDEATRVVTPPSLSGASGIGGSTALHMDWDEAEPPTRMRGEGMLDDEIPLPPALGLPMDWDDANSATQIYNNQDIEPSLGDDDVRAAEASSFAHADTEIASTALSGGRPSPFPVAARPLSTPTQTHITGAPSPFATTSVGREPWVESLRGGDKRTWIWAAAGALGLIVLALITRALVGGGAALGVITVATTPIDARVQIDGRAVSGSSSPYTLSDLGSGKHEIVVSKPGFIDYHGGFTLARGETKALPNVELVPSVREVGFTIKSAPPGAEVWVDGRASDQLTPARITGVSQGIHRLQLKRAGYADFDLQMFVPEATVLQLPTAELVVAGSNKSAAKAVASHVSESNNVDTAVEPSAAVERRASARAARLAKQAARSSGAATSYAPAARPAMPASQPMMAPAPSAAAGGGRMGTLRLNSRPWAQVFVDGRLMGNTPQPGLSLSAGNHQIKLVNQPMGLTKSFSISLKAGQVVTKVLNLAE